MLVQDQLFRPYKLGSLEDRCAPRVKIRVDAKLRYSGGLPFSVIVTDLSVAGFRCETVSAKRPPAICWLQLPGLAPLQSEVMWNDGFQIGCAFSRLLDPAVLDHILHTARRATAD